MRVVKTHVTQLDGAAAIGRRVADAEAIAGSLEQLQEAADRDEGLGQAHTLLAAPEALLVELTYILNATKPPIVSP